jgi:hypothetical protein
MISKHVYIFLISLILQQGPFIPCCKVKICFADMHAIDVYSVNTSQNYHKLAFEASNYPVPYLPELFFCVSCLEKNNVQENIMLNNHSMLCIEQLH